jgi:hypothetical protein
MARSISDCQAIGRLVARERTSAPMTELAKTLIAILRDRPGRARLANAIEHMWGHVRRHASAEQIAGFTRWPGRRIPGGRPGSGDATQRAVPDSLDGAERTGTVLLGCQPCRAGSERG